MCWFGLSLPEKRSNCKFRPHRVHEPTPVLAMWEACVGQEVPTEKCVLWERLIENVEKNPPDPVQRRLSNEAFRQRGSKWWCRNKRNCQRTYWAGQALFKPLILGIYFRKSDSSSKNLAIACADVFRLHPGVPADRQLGSLSSHWGCEGRYLKWSVWASPAYLTDLAEEWWPHPPFV